MCYLCNEPEILSVIIIFYVFFFASDMLDGQVARTCNMETKEGAAFDPFADKLLDLPILFALSFIHYDLFLIFIAIMIIILDIMGQFMRKGASNPAANWIGKTKTVLKIITIYILSLYRFPDLWDLIEKFWLADTLMWLSLIFAFASMASKKISANN